MNDFMDFRTVRLPCPACGHTAPKSIGWLKTHREYACDGCGTLFALDEDDLARAVRRAQEAVREKGL